MVREGRSAANTLFPAMREKLEVKLESVTIGGVKAFVLTPKVIAPENQNRVFLHFHGGAYVLNPGEPGTREATLMAAFGRAQGHLRGLSNQRRGAVLLPRLTTALPSIASCSRQFRRETSACSAPRPVVA